MRKLARPERLDEIKRLYELERLSRHEIAEVTGIPEGTVGWMIREKLGISRNRSQAATLHHQRLHHKTGQWNKLHFVCHVCRKRKRIVNLVEDRRYFPVIYCCKSCAR